MASAAANGPASAASSGKLVQATPTNAATVLPPTTAQGCAKGLAGRPNTSTALAPSGAASQGQLADSPSPP